MRKRKIIIILWILFGFAILVPTLLIILIANDGLGPLPTTDKLENPPTAIASEVLSADGKLLGKYYSENRSVIEFDDLSQNLINALVATEDARYYEHSGIDFRGLTRVLFKTILLQRGESGGGSTITQQLAKNLFKTRQQKPGENSITNSRNPFNLVIRKLQEWVIAVRLERFYTKEEIMAMYLNTVDFGSNAMGIKSAARTYFDKSPDSLNIPESAMIVGLLQAPTKYSPVRNPEAAKTRRNVVLSQMKKYDYITEEMYNKYTKEPIALNFKAESHNEGEATYFREYLRNWAKKWAEDQGYDLYADGLKIYTTIDSRMQQYAEDAAFRHMKEMQRKFNAEWRGQEPWKENPEIIDLTIKRSERYNSLKVNNVPETKISAIFNTKRKMRIFSYNGPKDTTMSPLDSIKYYKYFLQPGMMSMETSTGHVKAWVGGVDFRFFKYDHVDPRAKRQVGSTFKPIVYATAIKERYAPCTEVPNVPVVFEEYENWSPKNSDGVYGGMFTLKKGLAQSVNTITAWVMKQVGVKPVVQLATDMGIKSHLEPVPSLCLGTADISVYEMTAAFNTFNNKGDYIEPVIITRIEDKDGNVLREFPPQTKEALDEKSAYIMVDMLKGVAAPGGTAYRLRFRYGLDGPMGGKTGTTQNNSDGWFIGIVPQLTTGIWVGNEDRAVHFKSMTEGQGASLALPIFAFYMQKVYENKELGITKKDWEKPKEELDVELDCSKYEDQDNSKQIIDEMMPIY